VAERTFREDLYYRLAAATVHLPPLRARKVDIARLVEHELAAFAFTPHAKLVEACCVRPWPGNIRELRTAIRTAAIAARGAGRTVVRLEDLAATAGEAITPLESPERVVSPDELDRDAIVAALEQAGGVLSVAARNLGLHRTQLYRLLDRHGIARR
jgi:transcriptional regulator of acetoin/glycerol metabolism